MANNALTLSFNPRANLRLATADQRREWVRELNNELRKIAGGESLGLSGANAYTDATAAGGTPSLQSQIVVSDGQSYPTAQTITFASVAAGEVISVNGVNFRAVSGTAVVANNEFKRGVSDTADAASFVTTFNASTDARLAGNLVATSAAAVITLTHAFAGSLGNAATVESLGVMASGTVTYSSATGTLTTTINGVAITATAGATDTLSAAATVTAINASTNALVATFVTAQSAAGVVTILSKRPGVIGNTITLTAAATGGTATASGARLTAGARAQWQGAQAAGTVTIATGSGNYTCTINGVNASGTVAYSTDDATTAGLLADAINKGTNALVAGVINATAAAGVVTITSIEGGIGGNAITLAATGTGTTVSGARLTGGAVATHSAFAAGVVANSFPGTRFTGGAQNAPVTLQG